jgi:hypothetical protein
VNNKKVITTLLSSILFISSSGGIVVAASGSGNMTSDSAEQFVSKNKIVLVEDNASILKVSLEMGTEILQMHKKIEIPFSQTLDTTNADLYALDLTIKQIGITNTPAMIPLVDYTTAVEGNKIIVTFLGDYTDEYAVQVKDALYIRANGIPATQSPVYYATKNIHTNPEVLKVSLAEGTFIDQTNKQINIPFNQNLDTADADLYAYDLTIKQIGLTNVPTLVPMVDYTTAVEGNKIIVTFLGDYTDVHAVQVKDALYIRANGIQATQSATYFTTKNMDTIM